MAQKVQPQGLKSDGTLGTFRISDNNNLLVDFTPTSDDGLATEAKQDTIIEALVTNGIKIDSVNDLTFLIDNTDTHTFQDAATATGEGEVYAVAGMKKLVIEITGANITTSTITFQATGASGTYINIKGIRLTDYAMASSSSTVFSSTPELWLFDVEGLTGVRMNITTITGTNAEITVTGKLTG